MNKFLLAFLIAAATPAFADDYSVDGVFVLTGSADQPAPADAAKDQLRCALLPIINHKDGTYALYYLDADKFAASKQVSYVKYAEGACSMDKATQLEHCTGTDFNTGKTTPEADTFNYYTVLTPQKLAAQSFASADEFTKWKENGSKPNEQGFVQVLCDGVTEDMVKAHLASGINSLNQKDTDIHTFFDEEPKPADYDTAKAVIAALKK